MFNALKLLYQENRGQGNLLLLCVSLFLLVAQHAEAAAEALGLNYDIEKVTDMNAIIDAGVMRTPALAVNDDIVIEGSAPSAEKLKKYMG